MGRIIAMPPSAVNSKKHASFQLATFESTRCFSERSRRPSAGFSHSPHAGQGPDDKNA